MARDRDQVASRRLRGLRVNDHPHRWCPEESVSILVGPDYRCPACGNLTSTG